MEEKTESRKILIVGGMGLLGTSLVKVMTEETDWQLMIAGKKYLADSNGYERWNSNSRAEWKRIILEERWKPSVIINAAAMTQVDICEEEREKAWKNNVELVSVIAEMARKVDAKVIQISSDYVFDGTEGPYTETDKPHPINYYGKTKLAAENVCLSSGIDCTIIRTMWLYGQSVSERRTFVDWVAEQVRKGEQIGIAVDEVGNPTLTDDVAYGVLKIIERGISGIINIAGEERISRWEWANRICRIYGLRETSTLKPVKSAELNRAAARPLQSGFVITKSATQLEFKPVTVDKGLQLLRIQRERGEK